MTARHYRHRLAHLRGPPPAGGPADRSRSASSGLWEWTKSIVVALVVWFFLRTFLVEAFRIPSGSMENTLLIGDFLFVNKALYGAEVPLIHARLPAVREPRAQRHPGLRLGRGGGAQGREAADRHAGRHAVDGGGPAVPERPAGGRALRGPRRSAPLRGSDPARQDARVADAAPGAARHGQPTSPISRTGARSSCRPTRSS